MLKWNRGTLACGVLTTVVLLLVGSMATRVAARTEYPAADYLTFTVPVALPGVTLGSGDYSFRANYVDAGNVVQVRHRPTNRLVFQGMTERVQRPNQVAAGTVTLGEARDGEATPLLVWYPSTTSMGFRFRYDR